MEILILALVGGGIVAGGFCSYLAKERNRSAGGWFVLGFLFSIFALIAIAASPRSERTPHPAPGAKVQQPSRTPEQVAADDRFERWVLIVTLGFVAAGLIYVLIGGALGL